MNEKQNRHIFTTTSHSIETLKKKISFWCLIKDKKSFLFFLIFLKNEIKIFLFFKILKIIKKNQKKITFHKKKL
jgi:hypothetical protein